MDMLSDALRHPAVALASASALKLSNFDLLGFARDGQKQALMGGRESFPHALESAKRWASSGLGLMPTLHGLC